jgi:hypothetical protein
MATTRFLNNKLLPVGRFHFLKVGDWVYVFTIGKPTRGDVIKIPDAVGSNETFEDLPPASKITLALGAEEIRAKLTAFDDYQLMKDRRARDRKLLQSGLGMVLKSVGGIWGDNTERVASALAKRTGSLEKAHRAMRKHVDFTRLLFDINKSAPIKHPRSEPQTRSLKQDAETEMLRDLMDRVGVRVIQSGSDAYESKGLILMGLMTGWTSGKLTEPDTMRKRLATLKKRAGKSSAKVA